MCSASILIIFTGVETLEGDIQYFTHEYNASSAYTLPIVNMGPVSIAVMICVVGKLGFFVTQKSIIISFEVSKAILFILCHRVKNPTMNALAEANLNDVASNATALICGIIGMIQFSIIHSRDRQAKTDCIFFHKLIK
jgi:hypothetical protein